MRGIPDTRMKLELLTGRYEQPERSAVRNYLRPDLPVVELGGCVGVVACIANKLLRDPGRHVVLEANPLAIPHLRMNRETNGAGFRIVNQALAYGGDSVTFRPSIDFWGNSVDHNLSNEAPVTVPATQLSRILEESQFQDYALICDIEGQEFELVLREPQALQRAQLIIMEVHPHTLGEEKVGATLSRLNDLGFRILERSALVVVLGKN